MNHIYDILIVGGGPAGYTSALYAARAGLDAVVLEKLAPGGQMALSHQIDNYPGFVEGIDGFSLAQQMQQGAERFGAQTVMTEVHSLDLTGDIKTAHTSDGDYLGRTVILATGANPRPLGVPQERELVARMPSCEATRWTPLLCDVMPLGGGKHIGIQKVLDYYGFTREECMAFGDGENDISMLRYVGLGVAMGNADAEVKAAADYVTTSTDDSGIARALRRFGVIPA